MGMTDSEILSKVFAAQTRANIDKWKQACEELYQARIQELQERINQLEFELRHNKKKLGKKIIETDCIIFRHIIQIISRK